MGAKRRRLSTGERYDKDGVSFIQTKLIKSKCEYCSKCPNKLFVKDEDSIVFGTGTINANIVIILPTVEEQYFTNSNIINILAHLYNEITNRNIFEDTYITFATKCHKLQDYDTYEEVFKHCKRILKYELLKILPTDVILMGPYTYSLLGSGDTCGFISLHRLMNPNVFYTDKIMWEIFKKQFARCIFTIMNK